MLKMLVVVLTLACSTAMADGTYGQDVPYQSGTASFYWQPQKLAGGGRFNPNALTAAHKTLPLGTRVRVFRPSNGKSVDVTINDRGPYTKGRIIDLSRAAAHEIGLDRKQGLTKVQIFVISSPSGSGKRAGKKMASYDTPPNPYQQMDWSQRMYGSLTQQEMTDRMEKNWVSN